VQNSSGRPRIGIDVDHEHDGRRWIYKLSVDYCDAVRAAGGDPVLLLPDDPRPVPAILAEVDGVLLTGGDDVHPSLVGRQADGMAMRLLSVRRERFLLRLAAGALADARPCLAVCLGCQAVNIAAGGDIWLDLYCEHAAPLEHRHGHVHLVHAEPDGLLARYWQGEPQRLVSHHHQAVRRLGRGLILEATSEDGVIEAYRSPSHTFLLGVQWHPEVQGEVPGGRPLLRDLVRAAAAHASSEASRR